MFHSDIMRGIMRERARDLRAEAQAARNASFARRAREFWEEQAQLAASRVRRRPRGPVRPRSAAHTRCTSRSGTVQAR
ncbi:hypothetical protein AGRA3207_002638 [Actinomadura graeca]|uniref:Uncharacterized protein n=1 Tax=Actinomadura graeca TaxID=2750812 RepID=A0ABX8QSR6_9ACTN|nr:hypothetical protein [Actinomadura graeca]QXJ21751.1 hypothetical protein AGRA3207_002638 [Actinomadura graeca]